MWVAPNMVTLIGFMFILANVAILQLMIPDLVGPVSLAWTVHNCQS
jgi:ethanolaminephosphotransferase